VTFSKKLYALRQKMGLTQKEMGERLGVSRNLVTMMESGDRPASQPVQLLFDALWEKEMGDFEIPTESELNVVNESAVSGGRARLKALRIQAGYNKDRAKFARLVGYSPLIYGNIEDGSANMSRKMAVKVADALGCSVEDLLDGSDHPPSKGATHGTVGETPDIDLPPGQKARYVPLIGMARCGSLEHGDMVAFDDGGYEHEGFLVSNPEDPNVFAVTLAGDSMMPVFAPGDVAVIYPNKPPRNGGIVMAKLNGENGDGVMIKIYQQSGSQVTLSSYNAASYPPVTWQRKDFAWIYRVASVFKVLS